MKIKWLFIFCIILLSCTNNDISDYDQVVENCDLEEQDEKPQKILEKEEFYIICGKKKENNYWIQYEYFIFDEDKQLLYKDEAVNEPKIIYDELIVITNIAGTNVNQTKFVNIKKRMISDSFESPISYNQRWVATIDYKTSEIVAKKIFEKTELRFPIDIDIEYSMGYPVDSYIADDILYVKYQSIDGSNTEKQFTLK